MLVTKLFCNSHLSAAKYLFQRQGENFHSNRSLAFSYIYTALSPCSNYSDTLWRGVLVHHALLSTYSAMHLPFEFTMLLLDSIAYSRITSVQRKNLLKRQNSIFPLFFFLVRTIKSTKSMKPSCFPPSLKDFFRVRMSVCSHDNHTSFLPCGYMKLQILWFPGGPKQERRNWRKKKKLVDGRHAQKKSLKFEIKAVKIGRSIMTASVR